MTTILQAPTDTALRVLIIDDHRLVTEALSRYLVNTGTFEVFAAEDYDAGLALIAKAGPFDVVLLDVVMPGMTGVMSVKHLVDAASPGHVVIFSGNVREDFVSKCISNGAKGYIPKSFPLRSLANAIDLIASGECFIPANFTLGGNQNENAARRGIAQVEVQVLRLISDGQTNKQIAWELGTTEATIKMHVRSITRKLEASNRAHAVVKAQEADLI